MRRVIAILLFGTVGQLLGGPAQGFIWRTDDIKAEVRQDTKSPDTRHYLYLTQELKPDEEGWKMMKLDLPSHWKVEAVAIAAGRVRIVTADNGSYELTADNVPQLDFDILDGGAKEDTELERLWKQHALVKE